MNSKLASFFTLEYNMTNVRAYKSKDIPYTFSPTSLIYSIFLMLASSASDTFTSKRLIKKREKPRNNDYMITFCVTGDFCSS